MGATTGIEWANATVNVWLPKPWEGDSRYETVNWERKLRALNRKAAAFRAGYEAGGGANYERSRVFINSLSDTFEDWCGPIFRLYDGKPLVDAHLLDDVRARFFRVAEECSELDILLLTKRPENVLRMVPMPWFAPMRHYDQATRKTTTGPAPNWPKHIWMMTTVESQEHGKRIWELLKIPAKVRGLSVEPLLGPLCWRRIVAASDETRAGDLVNSWIHWVIVGGESGTNARPMHPDWVRSIRDQCVAARVPFFFKQWGDRGYAYVHDELNEAEFERYIFPDGTVRNHSGGWDDDAVGTMRMSKKRTGCMLDGREWNEVPK